MIGTLVFATLSLIMCALAWASLSGRHHPACKPEKTNNLLSEKDRKIAELKSTIIFLKRRNRRLSERLGLDY